MPKLVIVLAKSWVSKLFRRLVPASLTVVLAVVVLSRTSWFSARTSDAVAEGFFRDVSILRAYVIIDDSEVVV